MNITDSSLESSVLEEQDFSLLEKKSNPTANTKSDKKRFHWIIPILMVLIISGAAIYFASRREDVQPDIDIEYLTVPVQTQSLNISIEASGSIKPISSVNISPKTTSRLAALYVEQGDKVKTGQLLARMDSANLKAELAQAQAELAQAEAEYTEILNGNRPEDIAQAQAQLNQALARLANAQKGALPEEIAQAQAQVKSVEAELDLAQERVKRYQNLQKEGAISQDYYHQLLKEESQASANLSEAKHRLDALKKGRQANINEFEAEVEQTRQNLKRLENGARLEEINQFKAKVAAAQAKVTVVQTKLEDTNIRAPFDGIVSQRYATVGSIITPNVSASSTSAATSTSILSMASELEVNVNFSEANIAQIEPNQLVEIVADAYPHRTFPGRVKQIAPEAVVENNVTSFEVKVELTTGQGELLSGMNVDAVFIAEPITDELMVPTVAITTRDNQMGVLVADEWGKARFQPVTVGISQDGQTQILEGLKSGERVFIDFPEGKTPETFGNSM